jgi:tuftelin-interacting protein 11
MKRGAGGEEFGAFEKSTKGFGMKMLAKMGYKPGGGLGKEGQGIVNPIEIKLRARNTGLGFNEEESKRTVERRKSLEEVIKATLPTEGKSSWRQRKELNHANYDQEAERLSKQLSARPTKILDYTGAQVRELSSLSTFKGLSVTSTRFPELRHNLSLLSSMAERDLQNSQLQRVEGERSSQRLLEEQQKLLTEIARLEALKKETSDLKQLIFQATTELSGRNFKEYLPWLEKVVSFTRKEPHSDGNRFLACSLIVSALTPILTEILQSASLLDGEIIEIVQNLTVTHYGLSTHVSPFEQILSNCIIPKLRSSIITSLQSCLNDVKSSQYGAQFLLSWIPHLPPSTQRDLIANSVLPLLTGKLEQWRPHCDLALDEWLLPWMPALGRFFGESTNRHQRDAFYTAIRRQLATALQRLPDPTSTESLLLLSPWRPPILPTREFDILTGRYVLPRLEILITDEFDPSKADLTVLISSFSWLDVIPPTIFATILNKSLFPKLIDTLYTWMTTPDADYEKITRWYIKLKESLPSELLACESVQLGFNNLLAMMNELLDDPQS